MNVPSRQDYYLMQLAQMQTDKPNRYKLSDFRIEFLPAGQTKPVVESLDALKKRWRTMTGINPHGRRT